MMDDTRKKPNKRARKHAPIDLNVSQRHTRRPSAASSSNQMIVDDYASTSTPNKDASVAAPSEDGGDSFLDGLDSNWDSTSNPGSTRHHPYLAFRFFGYALFNANSLLPIFWEHFLQQCIFTYIAYVYTFCKSLCFCREGPFPNTRLTS